MTAAAARRAAQAILAEGRFHQPSVPRPLHGLLVELGRLISDPLDLVDRLVGDIGKWFPGGIAGVWVVLAVGLAGTAAWLAARQARQRLARPAPRPGIGLVPESAAAIERLAAAAEREGRWEDAVRLRFRAGVLRLSEREELAGARSMTSGQIARVLRSEAFPPLAHRFEQIAYGGAPAAQPDAEAQRRGWPDVLRG